MDHDPSQPQTAPEGPRPTYLPPTLTHVGKIVDIIQSGQGKLSTNAPDGPDVRKPPGQ
jgi:hypothetical protein